MTPNFVKFSRINRNVADVLGELVAKRIILIEEFAPLRPSHDDYDGGLELDGEMFDCDNVRDALQHAKGASCFGLSGVAGRVPTDVHIYFFDITETGVSVTLSFDPNLISYEETGLAMGEYLYDFLVAVITALRCDVAGFGPGAAYSTKHEVLVPGAVLERLRKGELFGISGPSFQAISTQLVLEAEMQTLLRAHPGSELPTYPKNPLRPYTQTAGFHILSRLPY